MDAPDPADLARLHEFLDRLHPATVAVLLPLVEALAHREEGDFVQAAVEAVRKSGFGEVTVKVHGHRVVDVAETVRKRTPPAAG
jgi:hypothetical protein